jgi:hypothetical protein
MIVNHLKNWLARKPAPSEPGRIKFHVAADVKASHHPDGVVLIHMGRGTVFSANRVGALIWKGAARQCSLDQVTACISGEFHIPPQTAAQDAAEFLEQLTAEGLLVRDAN